MTSETDTTFKLPLIFIGLGVMVVVIIMLVQGTDTPPSSNHVASAYAEELNLDMEQFNS